MSRFETGPVKARPRAANDMPGDEFFDAESEEFVPSGAAAAKPAEGAKATNEIGEGPLSILSRWKVEGPLEHISCGFPTLDKELRGGLVRGRVHSFVGAPAAGKSALAACVLANLVREGLVVGILAIDETADEFVVRFIQQLAHPYGQRDCEERDPYVLDDIAKKLEPFANRIVFFHYGTTVEEAALKVAERAKAQDCKGVLHAESLQTISCAASDEKASEYEQVRVNIRALKAAAIIHRLIVLTAVEMGRGGYANADAMANANPLAGGKGNSAIEYQSHVQLNIWSVPKVPDTIRVQVSKNRGGPRDKVFFLKLDRTHHTLTETEAPEGVAPTSTSSGTFQRKAETVLATVKSHPGAGKRELRRYLKEVEAKVGNDTLDDCLESLEAQGAVENRPDSKGWPQYFAVPKGVS